MTRTRVGILLGGRSGEHQVSLQSAQAVIGALDRERFEPVLIGIDPGGRWYLLDEDRYLLHPDDPARIALDLAAARPVVLVPEPGAAALRLLDPGSAHVDGIALDVVFPVLHGTFGEDGTIQGLFEMAGLAYVGSGVLGSSLAMDKDVAKRLLRDSGLPVVPFVTLGWQQWQADPDGWLDHCEPLGQSWFVKPANLGSSVGIRKAHHRDQLKDAIDFAFRFDVKVLVEQAVDGREIEVAVLGNEAPQASVAGEIVPRHEFYSYEAKYLDPDGAGLLAPAPINDEILARVQRLAVQAYLVVQCEGMARVDFLLERTTGELWINEINTLPGFTRISMYPRLWIESGMTFTGLTTRLIELALERHGRQSALQRTLEV